MGLFIYLKKMSAEGRARKLKNVQAVQMMRLKYGV